MPHISLIDSNSMPAGTNVVYLSYFKVTVSFQDFGTTRNAANKTPQLPVCCTIKGVFIAVSKYGIRQYTATENSESGYSYGTALAKLLKDYAAEAGRVTFAISYHMEERHVVEDKLLAQNHNVVVYPANHTDLHLGDVLFYMAAQLRKLKIARHADAYFEGNLGLNLFLENVVALFFHRMMQFASSLSPISNPKFCPQGIRPLPRPCRESPGLNTRDPSRNSGSSPRRSSQPPSTSSRR